MPTSIEIKNFKGSLKDQILHIRNNKLESQLTPGFSLLKLCNQLNINFSKIVEVGPSWPDVVSTQDILNDKQFLYPALAEIEVVLIEARPNVCQALEETYGYLENVKIFNYAIDRKRKIAMMYDYNHSTFLEGLDSPHVINQGPPGQTPSRPDRGTGKKFTVSCETFDVFDDGNIDILLMDVEGAEYFVLERLQSRPSLIICETHTLDPGLTGKNYINPYIDEISNWMEDEGYSLFRLSYSDSIFIKNVEKKT